MYILIKFITKHNGGYNTKNPDLIISNQDFLFQYLP